jgi:hypothetical protein
VFQLGHVIDFTFYTLWQKPPVRPGGHRRLRTYGFRLLIAATISERFL